MEEKSLNSLFSAGNIKKQKSYFDYFQPDYHSDYISNFQSDYTFDPIESTIIENYAPEFIKQEYRTQRNKVLGITLDSRIQHLMTLMESDPNLKGKYRITSTIREGAMTSNGKPSFHGKGMAFDIVPINGDFNELESLIASNAQIVSFMQSNGIGILDEYSETGRKRKTGSTGPHMHIGFDRNAVIDFNKILKKYETLG